MNQNGLIVLGAILAILSLAPKESIREDNKFPDKLIARELTIVDESGKPRVKLGHYEELGGTQFIFLSDVGHSRNIVVFDDGSLKETWRRPDGGEFLVIESIPLNKYSRILRCHDYENVISASIVQVKDGNVISELNSKNSVDVSKYAKAQESKTTTKTEKPKRAETAND